MKVCTKCKLEQPEDNFYEIKSSGKRHGSCKTCVKKRSKESSEKLGRRHRKNIELQWHYGITIEDYERMMEECNSQCVCGKTKGRSNREALHVDHCHDTGLIRGLLCHSCNRAIGLVNDPQLLRKLADYLESAESRSFKGNGGRASGC
jgi:hypothetical protein